MKWAGHDDRQDTLDGCSCCKVRLQTTSVLRCHSRRNKLRSSGGFEPTSLTVSHGSRRSPSSSVNRGRRYICSEHLLTCRYITTSLLPTSSSHAGAVVSLYPWKSGKFDLLSPKTPWTDRHQNLHGWLGRGHLPLRKISSRYD